MSIINNQRPGVYSTYDLSSVYTAPRSGSYAAVVAKAAGGETGKLYEFTSVGALKQVFQADGVGSALAGCVQVLLQSGVGKVYAVAVGGSYSSALALVEDVDNIGAVVCDATEAADLAALKASVSKSSESHRERLAYCGTETAAAALTAAGALNSERVVLCCPGVQPAGGGQSRGVYGGAALAGRVLAGNDCTYNFNGEELAPVEQSEKLQESQIQALLAAGVTVLEAGSSGVECVRALTTRTKTAGETDYALRGLNAILCIDDVMQSIRAALKATLRGVGLTTRSLPGIQAQVVVVLSAKEQDGVLASYDVPRVYQDDSDPAVCVVELAFRVAHVVSQIHVTAHIQV